MNCQHQQRILTTAVHVTRCVTDQLLAKRGGQLSLFLIHSGIDKNDDDDGQGDRGDDDDAAADDDDDNDDGKDEDGESYKRSFNNKCCTY